MIRFAPWLVALLAGLLLVPFIWLDPARGVTFSNAPFSDEAWNLVGARNLVLFGHPSTDEWRTWLLATPFMVIQAVAFALFGVDLVVARLVIVAVVAATGAVITWVLGGVVGTRAAMIAGIAYVSSALILYYGRLAFLEPLVGGLLAVGILSLVPAARGRATAWGAAGGLALALAVMTKGLAVTAAGAVVLVVLLAGIRAAWARRWLAGAVPTASAMAAGWGILVLWPNRRAVDRIIDVIYPPTKFPSDLGAALRQIGAFPFVDGVVGLALPLALLALAGGLHVGWLAWRNRESREGGTPENGGVLVTPIAAAAALIAGVGTLAIVDYQPNRYVVAFLPAAAILGAWAFPPGLLEGPMRRWASPALAAVLVAGPGLVLHAGWLDAGGSEVARIQALARGAIPSGATITGQYAPLVALGLPVRTVVPFEAVNDDDQYAAGARYVVWIDAGPPWMELHPEAWAARETIGCMTWSKVPTRSCIYRLPDPAP